MTSNCPYCGAAQDPGQNCSDRFAAAQLLELARPDYYAVHHLSVPCFMLQHNTYSQVGWTSTRELLRQFIVDRLSPAMARRRLRRLHGGSLTNRSYTRGPRLLGVEHIAWSMTIADVRLDTPETYCADVRAWASQVLKDTDEILRRLADTG